MLSFIYTENRKNLIKNHKKAQTTGVQTQINVRIFIRLVMMEMILNEIQLRQ